MPKLYIEIDISDELIREVDRETLAKLVAEDAARVAKARILSNDGK